VLGEYEGGIPTATSQDPTLATYASKVELEEGQIDWTKPARQLHNLIRAFSPRPGAWCWVEVAGVKKRLKIFRSQVLDVRGSPGEILSPSQAIIACGEDALKVLEVQPEGKKIMTGADWLRGQKLPVIQ
jgi:methionyl-tRNA formyltransferase